MNEPLTLQELVEMNGQQVWAGCSGTMIGGITGKSTAFSTTKIT